MDTIRICKQCQQPLPPDAPEGLCPQCLAKVALGTEPAKTIKLVLGDLPADERVGMTIGRYKLLEQIGEGGFGVVYVAEQKEPVRRRVALKVVKLGMDTRQVVARFEAERQALALMDHPNIAKVLDAGATETGRPFFVMELVRGMSITRYCDQNRLPMRERLDLFIQVCRAIQHAHQKGIVHRDIKPSNILVTLHDGVPVPKVIDFGIAKATQGVLSDKTVYTQFQQFIGTPAYMSPEQAEMSGLDIDTRSDIYSLGVLLYELLVGKTPFDQQELLAAGLDEMRRIIREIPPVRPSTRINSLQAAEQTTTANQRQSETPKLIHLMRGDLDCIVMKCLEKDRTHRYETSNGLAMDLVRFLNNEPITARPVGKFYRLQKLARRNKLAFGAAAAVALSLILGLAFSTFLFIREKKANASEAQMRRQAEAATIQAQNEAARAKAASLEAKSAELKAQEKETEAKTTLSAAEFLQGSRAIAEKRPGDALAYMARSFSDNPSNQAALTSMATLLAAHSWMVPTIVIGPANSAQFSPDGERIVTASDLGIVEVWDARNGAAITRIQVAGNGLPPGGPSQNATNTLVADHKVNSARFSPDGKRIVTAGWDQARVWDAQSGQPLTEVLQHNGLVSSAQFSPDGKCIVTVCGARAWIWEAQSGRQLAVVPPSDSGVPINSAEFSPDGRWLVTAEVGQFAIWEAQSGRLRTEVKGTSFDAVFNSAQYSPDGERIVTAGQADYTARIWDAQNGKQLMGPLQHTTPVNSAQFSPDGKRILTTTWGGTTRVWDAQSGAMLAGPATQGNRVNSAQYSRDAKRIVTATGTVARVWDAENGKALTEPLLHTSVVNSAQFSPDGKRVLTVSRDGTARVWEAENAQRPLAELLPQGGSSFAQFSADGTLILTVSGGSARIWNAQSRQPLTSINCVSAQFSPDGQRVVTVGPDYAVRVWNAHTGQLLTDPLRHAFMVKSAQFSPDGDRIVTVSAETWVWDARSGRALLPKPLQHRTMANWAQFSPDGDRLVTAWADGTASVWDAQSGRELLELPHGDFNFVNSAQFSPDGKRIVTLTQDGVARLWDASSGQQSAQLGGEVQSAQFSPDGSRILTTSGTTARLWDALSGQPLTEPLQHVSAVKSAQFSPDGKRIVTAAGSVARVWDSQTGQELMEPLSHGRSARPGEFKRGIYGSEVIGVIWFVDSAQFSPDGRRIITAADDGVVRIWDVAPSPATHPAWLPELAGAFSGLRLNDQGLLEPTRLSAAEVINRLRQELNRTSNDDDWVVWGRWLLADPATRTISPFSRQTVPEYIEERLTEGTTESFDEAERAAGENDLLLKRIAQARDNLELSSRALMLKHDADTLVAQGKLPEAEAKYSEVLDIDRKVRGPEHPDTIRAMHDLADSYYSLGRGSEAIVLLASACALDPTDTDASLTLATWQTWFGQDADYEATCRRLIQQAEGTNEAGTGERAGKAACLRPSTDGALLAKALALTQRAVELGQNTSVFRWYQLSLGLAEYRNDHYADAERTLVLAEQAGADNAEFLGIARFYHVMNLFRQNRLEQARKLFAQAEAEMPPFPQDVRQPLEDGKPVSHDRLICWMAYKEAQFLLNAQPKTVQEGR